MGFSIELVDGIVQANENEFKLVRGKDVDLTSATELTTGNLTNADSILIDEAHAGTQASTKHAKLSSLWTWVASQIGLAGITKGGIIVSDGSGDHSVLPAGTDTYVLTADASAASGLAWAVGGGDGTPQGIAILSNDGGSNELDTKYLRADGDGTCSWQTVSASTIDVLDESTDTTCFPLFATGAVGSQALKSGTNLTFNSNTGLLTATLLAGNLTGNVTGNVTGTAATVTQGAQTSITSVGALAGGSIASGFGSIDTGDNVANLKFAATDTVVQTDQADALTTMPDDDFANAASARSLGAVAKCRITITSTADGTSNFAPDIQGANGYVIKHNLNTASIYVVAIKDPGSTPIPIFCKYEPIDANIVRVTVGITTDNEVYDIIVIG